MVKSNLAEVPCHVLYLWIIGNLGEYNLQETVDGGMSNSPVERHEDVPLHLGVHFVIKKTAAHALELLDGGHTFFPVPVLGGNEQCRAADELIVATIHDTLGAVTVEEIDGKVECLGEQAKGGVGLDEKVK